MVNKLEYCLPQQFKDMCQKDCCQWRYGLTRDEDYEDYIVIVSVVEAGIEEATNYYVGRIIDIEVDIRKIRDCNNAKINGYCSNWCGTNSYLMLPMWHHHTLLQYKGLTMIEYINDGKNDA